MSRFKYHLKEAFKSDSMEVLYSQMILCTVATSIPLFLGFYYQQLEIAIYGGLTGYFLTIYEQYGTLTHRLFISTLSFFMLVLGFIAGLYLKLHLYEYFALLTLLAYWVGLMGGEGAELERAALFSTFQLIIAANSFYIDSRAIPYLLPYAFTSYALVLLATFIAVFIFKKDVSPVSGVMKALKQPLVSKLEVHLHAISYALITLMSALLMEYFNVERGYWTVITILLILKPDRTQSLYRSFQRFVGTCFGVAASVGVVHFLPYTLPMICVIACCAGFVPWAMKKNYWLVSFLISIIVILLLDLPAAHHGNIHTPVVRLEATLYGSLLSLVGVVFSKLLDTVFIRRHVE